MTTDINTVFDFISDAHAGQTYGLLPYSVHAYSVALTAGVGAVASGADINFAMTVGALHDVLEDTDVSFDQLRAVFGLDVAAAVKALSKDPRLNKSDQMDKVLQNVALEPREVAIVKMADRYENLKTIPTDWSAARALAYALEARKIADALGGASDYMYVKLCKQIDVYQKMIVDRDA